MSTRMNKVLGIILALISLPAFGLSIACQRDSPAFIKAEGVSIEWHSQGLQKIANVFVPRDYKGEELYDVALDVGVNEFDAKGNEIKVPIIGVNLKVREFKNNLMVQVFISEETPKTTLIIQYGEHCGYFMIYEITHNKLLKSDAKRRAL